MTVRGKSGDGGSFRGKGCLQGKTCPSCSLWPNGQWFRSHISHQEHQEQQLDQCWLMLLAAVGVSASCVNSCAPTLGSSMPWLIFPSLLG